jgi:tetratricopeptide (TPR) repeat protein
MAFRKDKALKEAEESVSRGKIAQAIKTYQEILDNDPSDVSLLNTVGDLYIRDRNITEGLRQFHKLAEAYVRDGFNVKAIAIYRKISKVDPNAVDTLLKLAELYQLQGLSREAREQYLTAADFFKKRNQAERALEVLRKVVHLDPENLNFRNRLATECEQMGKREDAAQAYLESAQILLRRDDQAAAESALKKAAEMNPKNSKIQMMRARVAIARQQPEEAEKIITSTPELQSDPEGKRILLDSYLGSRKLPEAEKLVLEVFHANPSDFAPVSSVSALLVEKGEIEEAYKLLAAVADTLISQNNGAPLLESLRRIWSAAPKHIPTMELIHQVCERTADELTLPEVLEALGHVYEEAGDLEKAEAAYLKLTEREPENENFHGMLNAIQRKLGRDIKPVDFSAKEMALVTEEEAPPPQPAGIDTRQEAMVKEALENSDLFSRYNLTEKAIAELEKVLQFYPDQVEIHRRILEISRKNLPERAAAAAAQLARIVTVHGDHETASKYEAIASAKSALHEIPLPPPPPSKKVEQPAAPPPAPPAKPEVVAPVEFPISALPPEEPAGAAAAPPPEPASFDLTPVEAPAAPPPPPAQPVPAMELDLSGDLDAFGGMGFEKPEPSTPEPNAPLTGEIPAPLEILAPAEIPAPPDVPAPVEVPGSVEEFTPPPVVEEAAPPIAVPSEPVAPPPEHVEEATVVEAPLEEAIVEEPMVEETIPVDLEDSRIEVEFYLENGFVEEARRTMAALEEKYPRSLFVAELRKQVNERLGEAPPGEPAAQVAHVEEVITAEPPAEIEVVDQAPGGESPEEVVVVEPAEPEVEVPREPAQEEWELPTSYAATAEPEPAKVPVEPVSVPEPEAQPQVANVETPPPAPESEPVVEEPVAAESAGMDMLGDLAGDFASTLDGIAEASPPNAAASPMGSAPSANTGQGASQLSGLLAEMEEPGGDAAAAAKDDPETHYNLGVAFREMGLLDEAIGEFQKVVKSGGKGTVSPNFLQACSLLAICFMEKKMPAIAAKWYLRALETPGLDEEAVLALQYDLGIAYEQAGDSRSALERFTEVYSQNIDFRDVAEKIRELQQKA